MGDALAVLAQRDPQQVDEDRPVDDQDRSAHRLGSLAASPDGKLLAAGDETGLVFIWEAATGRLRRVLTAKAPEECAAPAKTVTTGQPG